VKRNPQFLPLLPRKWRYAAWEAFRAGFSRRQIARAHGVSIRHVERSIREGMAGKLGRAGKCPVNSKPKPSASFP
jgi:hypothetical protein